MISLKCIGPVDQFGDPKPDEVSGRVGFIYHVEGVAEHYFALERDEVEKLRDKLIGVLYQIEVNRARQRTKPAAVIITERDGKQYAGPLPKIDTE